MEKNRFTLSISLVALMIFLFACQGSQENVQGKGKIILDLEANTSYASLPVSSRALDLTPYKDVNNYTVEISKDGTVIQSKLYGDMELSQEMESGEYTIRAYYGNNVAVGYDQLYVEGSQIFILGDGETKNISFACVPANVKVKLTYQGNFFDYYSDCKVNLKTQYLTEPFSIASADTLKDVYFKASANESLTIGFDLKDKQEITVTPQGFGAQTVTVSPRDFLTIVIKPKLANIEGGKIEGITVAIDNGVTEELIDVMIPDEYLPGDNRVVNN